jgi:hypothetical protein
MENRDEDHLFILSCDYKNGYYVTGSFGSMGTVDGSDEIAPPRLDDDEYVRRQRLVSRIVC